MGHYPIYNITTMQFNVAYRAVSPEGVALPQEEVQKYITPMWIQMGIHETADDDVHPTNETKSHYH